MAKAIPDAVYDAALGNIANNMDMLHVCSAQPGSYAAISTYMLAQVALTAGDGNGDYTISNGDVSGRKLNIAAQNGVSITNSGNATHIVLSNGSDTLGPVTTCTTQALTSGGTVDVPTWDIEFADPT